MLLKGLIFNIRVIKVLRKTVLFRFVFISFLLLSFSCQPAFAFAFDFPNNKFGIHLAQPEDKDLEAAAKLVNSSGGDWGYVTLVIQENDRDLGKWQEIFNKLRRLHLIPIIRLATKPEGSIWRRPSQADIPPWVNFLSALNWVVKNRYVVLFNEPNHGLEWGGKVDGENYGEIAFNLAQALKKKNPDFFIMLAGFDANAPHQPPKFEDEEVFLKTVFNKNSRFLTLIDGWVSHSYPNPGYAGSPFDLGRNSIRNYQWELQLLKRLGVSKELPVFITETGWVHQEGLGSYSPETISRYFQIAYENVWLTDDRVWAVTPFILNYQGEPFAPFSWALPGREDFYPQYYALQQIPKIKGEPERKHKVSLSTELPQELVERSTYQFKIKIKNEGQAIYDKQDGYQLALTNEKEQGLKYFFSDFNNLEPFNEQIIDFHLKTTDRLADYQVRIGLFKDKKLIVDLFSWRFKVVPWPSLTFKVELFPKRKTRAGDFEIQIFDEGEQLVYKRKNVRVVNGQGGVKRIGNIAFGKPYRVVVLKPYYLPRQRYIVFKKDNNKAVFKKMIPLDFNRDGKLSFSDLAALIKDLRLLKLWLRG